MSGRSITVTCYVCCKEITRSAALTPEGMDYVGYFCGLKCYQQLVASANGRCRSLAGEHPTARQEKNRTGNA